MEKSAMSKTWFITGSSRGLGRSLARAALAAGHRVAATARQPEQLADLVEHHGERVLPLALDVTDAVAARAAVEAAVSAFGRLDVVVNNAGYGNVASIEDVTEEDFRAQIETNLFGVVHVTRAALPVLRRQRSGHFMQVSSIGGRIGTPGVGAYQTAKFAVEGFSEVLARETAPLGIKVTIVEPGGFRTDWAGSSMTINAYGPDYEATIGTMVKHFRQGGAEPVGDPDKAAQVLLQLADLPEPPLRLLLGSDAVQLAELADKARMESDRKWRHLSVTTDADPEAAAEQVRRIVAAMQSQRSQ